MTYPPATPPPTTPPTARTAPLHADVPLAGGLLPLFAGPDRCIMHRLHAEEEPADMARAVDHTMPPSVHFVDRALLIRVNDATWRTPADRARALWPLGRLAQGTASQSRGVWLARVIFGVGYTGPTGRLHSGGTHDLWTLAGAVGRWLGNKPQAEREGMLLLVADAYRGRDKQ